MSYPFQLVLRKDAPDRSENEEAIEDSSPLNNGGYFKVSEKANKQLKKLRIEKQFEKQKHLFRENPFHPSLDFKQLKGAKGFYAFRINQQYRANLKSR